MCKIECGRGETLEMSKYPKVSIHMGQDGETYTMIVQIAEGISVAVDLGQSDVDHLKLLLDTIERVWAEKGSQKKRL